MTKNQKIGLTILILILAVVLYFVIKKTKQNSSGTATQGSNSDQTLTQQEESTIQQNLASIVPNINTQAVSNSPIGAQVTGTDGSQVISVSGEANNMGAYI